MPIRRPLQSLGTRAPDRTQGVSVAVECVGKGVALPMQAEGLGMTESVLVIDNDASIVELLSYLFQQEGLTVHRALDGAEGVMLATAYKPDVIVCDLLMERLD